MDGSPRRPEPQHARRSPGSGSQQPPAPVRRGAPDEAEDLLAAQRDLEGLETSVQRLGPSGRGPLLAAALIVLAFAVGLVRPWDWLGLGAGPVSPSPGASADVSLAAVTPQPTLPAAPTGSPVPAIDAAAAKTCDYPQSWRSATLQDWAGRRAEVWTAVDAVEAAGPLDPAIVYTTVAGSQFTAIGWCAPVDGPARPPDDAVGTLFRVAGGKVTRPAFTLLEPEAPNPLAGLLGPALGAGPAQSPGAAASSPAGSAASAVPSTGSSPGATASLGATGPTWAPGRYVILLVTPDGRWQRWIGVELRAVP